jgi:hypothetical protein
VDRVTADRPLVDGALDRGAVDGVTADRPLVDGALDRGAGVLGYDRPGQRRCRYRSTWPPRLGH